MKKTILVVALLLTAITTNAQFYVSASGGYAISSAGVKFGEETTANGIENTYGSYGEGLQTQLRGGYFFNDTFGVEVGLGYLHGADQTSVLVNLPTQLQFIDIKARGRAYAASASFVYKFTNNIYGRFGGLIKVGGRTESVGKINVAVPTGILEVDYVNDYRGRLPLGFIGAVGYKYDIGSNVSLFAEVEYMGISVTRDKSEMTEFTATFNGGDYTIEEVKQFFENHSSPDYQKLAAVFNSNVTYVDESPLGADKSGAEQLSQKVPYSSFGINFGFTYTFGK